MTQIAIAGQIGTGATPANGTSILTLQNLAPGTLEGNVVATTSTGSGFAAIDITGSSLVSATATATSGQFQLAYADATASGLTPSSTAIANNLPGTGLSSDAKAICAVGTTTTQSNSIVQYSVPLPTASQAASLQAASHLEQDTRSFDITEAMANSPNDSAAFDFYAGTHPVSGVPLALIELAATASTSASTLTSQDEVDIDVAGGEVPTGAHLALGLLNTTTIDPSFESLEFLLTDSGATIVNKTFNSLASAQAYFDDQLIDLGPILSASSIHVEFDITTDGQGQGLNSEFVLGSLPVPEPTAGALGSMAMLALLPRRRRRAPRD